MGISAAATCRDSPRIEACLWLFSTSPPAEIRVAISPLFPCFNKGQQQWGIPMKKLAIALLATLVAVSVSGCAGMGKGKARPPVVTKG